MCLASSALIVATAWGIDSARFNVAMDAVPTYFLLSGMVTACGLSAILDVVPSAKRGLAMAISFFLNVALGAGLGPTSVALMSAQVFGVSAGLGPAIASIASAGYALNAALLAAILLGSRLEWSHAARR